MHISLMDLERESYKKTHVHLLDGRIKILIALAIVVYAVSLPRMEPVNFLKLGLLEAYLIILLVLARLKFSYLSLRFALALPFGLTIAVLQAFLKQPFIRDFTVLYTLPPGLEVTREGILFGTIIFAKFLVCITSIILLSSTTSMSELVSSSRRLGMPRELALLFTMMVRYLFVFWKMLLRIRTAQKTRCFELWNRKVPRMWTLEQVGYTISSLFIRSYEQGERTFQSMLCRGYSADTNVYVGKKKISITDIVMFAVTIGIITAVQMIFV
ncbi:MAG: cobalt ECF transporter T component CbiQ [Candidatus Methanoperedens sp.]|nr:cobalt ECF transporter T component CbiQ [Candidatus Methanoperedens sp.]PKL53259.1 MAG: cobalt ECF transporter T component CbiQ [Candidatus Methanoperedenaceae archaeon HGW-Methanoperedenaceae-1]